MKKEFIYLYLNMFLKRGDDLKKIAPFFLSILIAMGAFPDVTSACKCAGVPSAESEFKRSKAVFSGKVLKIEDKEVNDYLSKSILFEVTNTWKGVEESQIIITTGQGGGDCGFDFTEGQEYLVYANESDMYGEKSLITGICNRTNHMGSLMEDLKVLGAGQPPIKKVDLTVEQSNPRLYLAAAAAAAVAVTAIAVVAFIILKKRKGDKLQ